MIRHTAVIPFGGNIITDDIKEGCTILQRQAELLKTKFGAAIAINGQENEIVCIPGLKGRDPKEISVKNLSEIIRARMEEIIEHIYYEIKSSGYERKLIGGIVITGGGSQLKYIRQLFEFVTGMDARIGLPTEQLGKNTIENITTPTYATGVGLVIKGFESLDRQRVEQSNPNKEKQRIKSNFFEKIVKGFFDENID
jgi:cell division protein FtsA